MYRLLQLLVKTLSLIPFGMLYFISDLLYFPVYYIIRYRRKIVRGNLVKAFPELTPKEITTIEKKFYHFFIDLALEGLKLFSISEEELSKRMTFPNIDEVNAVLKEGRSVSLYLGHYCNWEWIASLGLVLYKGAEHAQIYHKVRNKPVDRLVQQIRCRFGSHNVEMHNTVRFIASELKHGKPLIIGFIADQSPNRHGVKDFIPFLNHNVPVLTGTEKLTKHFGFDAMFASVRRVKRGYYECVIKPLCANPKELPDFQLTELYFNRLEQEIKENPEYYLWSHNRFKYSTGPVPHTTQAAD